MRQVTVGREVATVRKTCEACLRYHHRIPLSQKKIAYLFCGSLPNRKKDVYFLCKNNFKKQRKW